MASTAVDPEYGCEDWASTIGAATPRTVAAGDGLVVVADVMAGRGTWAGPRQDLGRTWAGPRQDLGRT